ncbi:MAG TPA: hypothetical protein VGT98_07100 [Candidatus Elarobacter sp.]|nr:hypothetical protein [Candidatus Elarobacter sp.]
MAVAATTVKADPVIEAQLLLLQRQLAAISAVIDLIEADFLDLLDGQGGVSREAQ